MRLVSQDGEDLEELEQTLKLEPLQMVSARWDSDIHVLDGQSIDSG